MILLSVAKLKMFSPESKIFLWIKPKKKKKTFLWKVWINAHVYKNAKRQEMFFVMSLRLSYHKVLRNIASSSQVYFLAFFARISYFNFLEFKEFRLVIANSALRTSLAIYHLISNARSWNSC